MQERFEIEPIPEPSPDLFIFIVSTSNRYLAVDTGRLSRTQPRFISIKHSEVVNDDLLLDFASHLHEHKDSSYLDLRQESDKILSTLIFEKIAKLIYGNNIDEMPTISVSVANSFEGLGSDEFSETFDHLRDIGLLDQTREALNIFRKKAIIQGSESSQTIWQDPNSISRPQN